MRRVILALLVLLVGVFGDECMESARKLVSIQNSIVENSYKKLHEGAWARYRGGEQAVYLGERVIDGKRLFGVELMVHPPYVVQTWYRVVPKRLTPTLTMLTIDPTIVYFNDRNGRVYKLNKSLIELYYAFAGGGKNLSTILTPAVLNTPPACENRVRIQKKMVRIGDRSVIGHSIESLKNGALVIVSDQVPFGIVRTQSSNTNGKPFELVNFGFDGKKPVIDDGARARARPFVLPFGGGR